MAAEQATASAAAACLVGLGGWFFWVVGSGARGRWSSRRERGASAAVAGLQPQGSGVGCTPSLGLWGVSSRLPLLLLRGWPGVVRYAVPLGWGQACSTPGALDVSVRPPLLGQPSGLGGEEGRLGRWRTTGVSGRLGALCR